MNLRRWCWLLCSGRLLENNLRKSLILSQGDLMTFVQRPISAVCLVAAAILLIGPLLPSLRKKRELVALDEGPDPGTFTSFKRHHGLGTGVLSKP
jgi:hypothetical protein